MAAGFEDGAVYCNICEVWLNGPAQWDDHKLGRKHRRNDARNDAIARMQRDAAESPDACAATPGQAEQACAATPGQAEQEDPPDPGFIRISLLALSGNIIGSVLCRSKATWPEVAVTIRRANPTLAPVPPPGARDLQAADLVGGVQVITQPLPSRGSSFVWVA